MLERRSDLMEQPSTKDKFQWLKRKLSKSPSETETSVDSALRDQVDDAPLRIRAALDVALRDVEEFRVDLPVSSGASVT